MPWHSQSTILTPHLASAGPLHWPGSVANVWPGVRDASARMHLLTSDLGSELEPVRKCWLRVAGTGRGGWGRLEDGGTRVDQSRGRESQ